MKWTFRLSFADGICYSVKFRFTFPISHFLNICLKVLLFRNNWRSSYLILFLFLFVFSFEFLFCEWWMGTVAVATTTTTTASTAIAMVESYLDSNFAVCFRLVLLVAFVSAHGNAIVWPRGRSWPCACVFGLLNSIQNISPFFFISKFR